MTVIQLIKLSSTVRSFYPLPPVPQTPLSINAPLSGYLKLIKAAQKEKKLKQVELGNSHMEGRALNNCAVLQREGLARWFRSRLPPFVSDYLEM